MPICIFNKDADHRYRCEYEVRPNSIKVDVEYDIGKELETEEGVRIWSSKVEFDDRDILIVDSESKASYLLKKASYAGMSSRYGTFDGKEITSFVSNTFFKDSSHEKLMKELSDNQIKHYAQEIISLRNHYVHSGYFIKNGCLRIDFGKDEKELQDYTANVDVNWIYERTRLLYAMVIDIIFKDMLGIEEYDYRGNYVLC